MNRISCTIWEWTCPQCQAPRRIGNYELSRGVGDECDCGLVTTAAEIAEKAKAAIQELFPDPAQASTRMYFLGGHP